MSPTDMLSRVGREMLRAAIAQPFEIPPSSVGLCMGCKVSKAHQGALLCRECANERAKCTCERCVNARKVLR